jgi:hypothetical protein
MAHAGKAVKPKYGEKMIEVKIRFWTDEMSDKKGYIVPKHGWTGGVVRMERNESHGIVPGNPKPFNSLMEIPAVIEKVLVEHDIKLSRLKRMATYIE